ncbi:MAG: phosphatase PAP2 family protein [Ramlibacter sp.]|nr:phosphatase PAP2 family protein [Ramlibacter sp.]MBX3660417.1 phosphatase PAP2 family protein [Ramlibacter sp.]MCW5652046.1 phosphatase PAP2 family protein [Ramlibacter sp.]
MHNVSARTLVLATAGLTLALLGWDYSGLDLTLARWFGGPAGFPLHDAWWLENVAHEGGRRLAWAIALALCLGAWWPVGPLRRLAFNRRLQLASTTLLAVALISILKSFNHTSCPWDLAEFGGVAHYVSHWALAQTDGGPGRCFPAGHASAGFAFVGGYFAFRGRAPHLARAWLVAAVAAGLALGWSQQMRGAHFMSHTLWTGWVCWCLAWALDVAWSWAEHRHLLAETELFE